MRLILVATIVMCTAFSHASNTCTSDTDCLLLERYLLNDFEHDEFTDAVCDGWMEMDDQTAEDLSNVQMWCDTAGY